MKRPLTKPLIDVLGTFTFGDPRRTPRTEVDKRAFKRLAEHGMIAKFVLRNGDYYYTITSAGRQFLAAREKRTAEQPSAVPPGG